MGNNTSFARRVQHKMAVPKPKPTETTTDHPTDHDKSDSEEDKSTEMKPVPVVTLDELEHFHALGLGRAIDSSDSEMWKNKSPIQVRTIDKDFENIIATDESGIISRYEKTVSSLKTQQTKIQTALSDPASSINIGLDAHYSQSSSSTVTIKGTKVKTRTISFIHDIEELPISQKVSPTIQPAIPTDEDYSAFEISLSIWIITRLEFEQRRKTIPDVPDISTMPGTDVEKLNEYVKRINSVNSMEARVIELACRTYVFNFGVTHYVSAIELGALTYSVESTQSRSTNTGVGGNIGVGSIVSGSASTNITNLFKTRSKQEQEIGHMSDKGVVRRDTSDEAVIGFQIQPISTLIRQQKVRLALIIALEIYLQSKTDDTVGPFLVSAKINKKPIYWKVDQEELTLIGTEDIQEASLFYIISAGNRFSPTNFTIAYWGDKTTDRKLVMSMSSPLTQQRPDIPSLPTFLTTEAGLFDLFRVPLHFSESFSMKTAQYTLHSRIFNSFACFTCMAGPASVQTLLEGDEFYIRHSPNFFNRVYLAIIRETKAALVPSYTSAVFPSTKFSGKKGVGMLFRLHPYQLRKDPSQPDIDPMNSIF